MENKKPIALVLAGAFAANAITDAYCGFTLFTDLPPLAAVTLGSTAFTGATNLALYAMPRFDAVTDQPIEMPAPVKDRGTQS